MKFRVFVKGHGYWINLCVEDLNDPLKFVLCSLTDMNYLKKPCRPRLEF